MHNLSIQNKILFGFFLITGIFFCLSVFQYNAVESVNAESKNVEFAGKMGVLSGKIKYLLAKDMVNLRDFVTAKNDKELKSLRKTHLEYKNKIQDIFNTVNNTPDGTGSDAKIRHNFRDTILSVAKLFSDSYLVSYNEIYFSQQVINNPEEVENFIRQKELENSQNGVISDLNFNEAEQTDNSDSVSNVVIVGGKSVQDINTLSQNYVAELKYEQSKHYQIIIRLVNDMEKILSITESRSAAILKSGLESSNQTAKNNITSIVIFFVIAIVLSVLLSVAVSRLITEPLEKLKKYAARLAKGELPEYTDEIYNDELGVTIESVEQLTVGLQKTSDFAYAIGRGDFSSNYQPLSDKDVLGNSLLNMRKSLQQAKLDEQKRQSEDIQRSWATEGLALFAEILRHHTDDISELSDDIIVNLVKYIKANQGGIFIYNDSNPEDIHLELLSAYAYNRKKFIKRKIKVGEGLVGAAAEEKYTLYVTDIPDDYIEIESGIGSANPTSLLIVPLKIENEILGVIELASFNELKNYEIELVEKIAESIASTLSTARINTRTAELLEQSKATASAMKAQESQMRQTIEEMKATQEDSMHREEEFYKELKEVEAVRRTLEQQTQFQDVEIEDLKKKYDTSLKLVKERETYENNLFGILTAAVITAHDDGTIIYVNELFTTLFGYKSAEVIGRSVYKILGFTSKENEMALALQSEFGTIVNTKGREIKIKTKNDKETAFRISVTATMTGEKILYTFILDDLTALTAEREKSKFFEEEMLTNRFDLESKAEAYEALLKNNGIELPGSEAEYTLLNFNNGYKIGLNIIDKQHQKWFDVINRFYAAYKRKDSKENIIAFLTELADYSGYQFGFKEKYLQDFDPNVFAEHKAMHNRFSEMVNDTKKEFTDGSGISVVKLVVFIKDWMRNYFSMLDAEYVAMFKRNGLS